MPDGVRMVLEEVETNTIAIDGLEGFNTIGIMALKILMRQKCFRFKNVTIILLWLKNQYLKVAEKTSEVC